MRYDTCLFDFDGTVADTGEGIRRSVAYALERLGLEVPDDATLNRFIGPPLQDTFQALYGMDDALADRAVAVFRERYTDIGIFESKLYPGIAPLLKALHGRGAHVALASSKPSVMLERLCGHFGIAKDIDVISGVSLARHSADKRGLLLAAMPENADFARTCMVGDRRFDIEAARALGIAALGALYGYAPPGELEAAGADRLFESVEALGAWLTAE